MGKSITINVIGFGAEQQLENGDFRRYECHAMNKMEMAQKKKVMAEKGYPITGWFAQTNAGCKMIGADFVWEEVLDKNVNHVKLIECPICNGIGTMPLPGKTIYRSCVVCNGSGITKKNYWNKWQEWQLNEIRKEFTT